MNGILRTILDTVHANMAFTDPEFQVRITTAMTIAKTLLTISAFFDIPPDS
jgi:hypothetical protein